jgi:D-alanyl-D-alanine carboxypeptidase (penicillin-binding protein 5/6)
MPAFIALIVLASYWLSHPTAISSFRWNDVVMAAPLSGKVDTVKIPAKKIPVASGISAPTVAAESYAVYDTASGFILTGSNPHQARSIASITKLMTVLVFLDHNPGWSKEITITRADYREGGRIYLYPGDTVTAGDLFRAGLVASDNVAIAALVRSTGMSEADFVREMNRKADSLHLKETTFADPTGLKHANQSSAHDVARLATTAFKEPAIRDTVVRNGYTFTTKAGDIKRLPSTDKLLETNFSSGIELIAGKTGYLNEAGYCFVGQFEKDGHLITTVVLGAESEEARFDETKRLAEWAFGTYRW